MCQLKIQIQLEFLHCTASLEGVKCVIDGSMHYSPNLLLCAYFKYLIIAWLIIGASSVEEQSRGEGVNCSMQLFTDCYWKCAATATWHLPLLSAATVGWNSNGRSGKMGKTHPETNPFPLIFKCIECSRGQKSPPGATENTPQQPLIYWCQELGGEKAVNLPVSLLSPSFLELLHPGHPRNLRWTNFSCVLHWRCKELHLNWIWKRPRTLVAKSHFWGCVVKESPESRAVLWNRALRGFWAKHKQMSTVQKQRDWKKPQKLPRKEQEMKDLKHRVTLGVRRLYLSAYSVTVLKGKING